MDRLGERREDFLRATWATIGAIARAPRDGAGGPVATAAELAATIAPLSAQAFLGRSDS